MRTTLAAGLLLLAGTAEAFSPSPMSGIASRSRGETAVCMSSDSSSKAASGSGLSSSLDRRSFAAALGLAAPMVLLSTPDAAEARAGKGDEKGKGGDWADHNGPFKPNELEGFTTAPSGLQYKVIQEGSGAKPAANQKVSARCIAIATTARSRLPTDGSNQVKAGYAGYLLADGKKFDASYDRGKPFTFNVSATARLQAAQWHKAILGMPSLCLLRLMKFSGGRWPRH